MYEYYVLKGAQRLMDAPWVMDMMCILSYAYAVCRVVILHMCRVMYNLCTIRDESI